MKAGFDYIGISTAFYCTDRKGRFLMAKRSANCRDEHGTWEHGAGQLEFGENPDEGVLREVWEEYCVRGEILARLTPYSLIRKHEGQTTHWLVFPYVIGVDPKLVQNGDPDKLDELGWYFLHALPEPLHSGVALELKQYAHELARFSTPPRPPTPDHLKW